MSIAISHLMPFHYLMQGSTFLNQKSFFCLCESSNVCGLLGDAAEALVVATK